MNAGNIVVQKIVALFYREMKANALDHLWIALATL
jgi:hypothetical protein